MTLKQSTIYEEELAVIVRRRGCTLRVQITSIEEDTRGESETTPGGDTCTPDTEDALTAPVNVKVCISLLIITFLDSAAYINFERSFHLKFGG